MGWRAVARSIYEQTIGLAVADGPGKRPGCSGPLWDAFVAPAIWVYEDRVGDEATVDILRQSAERSASWDTSWKDQALRWCPASALTEAQRRSLNIIYFTADVDRAPLVSDQTLPRPFADRSADYRVAIRPSPWRDSGYLVVVEARGEQPIDLGRLGWGDQRLRSDWLTGRFVTSRDGRARFRLLRAGSYDHRWRPGVETAVDPRSRVMLGPASGGY